MTNTKQIINLTLTFLLISCSTSTEKYDFVHNYEKYWDQYTEQQLIDTLFSDTLMVGPDAEGGWTTREFYINTTKDLLADLKDDKNKVDSLYPMTSFDELTIKKLPLGFKKAFTNEQTQDFLQILNNPVSFVWTETTYEPEYRIEFLNDNKVVATLTISGDRSIVKTEPDWPAFKKMKFGRLKPEQNINMARIINELDKKKL